MTETEEAVARVAMVRANLAGLRDPDIQADRQALDTILTALASEREARERAERERDEASDGVARWMIRMSKIREAAGVGSKPMLEELPGKIAAILTRAQAAEAALAALKAEVVEVLGEAETVVSTYRAKTPLGHQPHMLGARADKLLQPLRALLAALLRAEMEKQP